MTDNHVLLRQSDCGLLVVDIQDKLFRVIADREHLLERVSVLIRGFQLLKCPVYVTEQYPKGLGITVPPLTDLLKTAEVFEKITFSCCAVPELIRAFRIRKIKQVVLSGIETHICVWQTAMDLMEMGFSVTVVSDAVSSRSQINTQTALKRMLQHGIEVSSVEMVLFEMLKTAGTEPFKAVSELVK